MIQALLQQAPWLDLGPAAALCGRSADALDAVLAAIVAGAVHLDRTIGPETDELPSAEEEGWIHLPDPDFLADPWAQRVPGTGAGQLQATPARPARLPSGPSSDVTS